MWLIMNDAGQTRLDLTDVAEYWPDEIAIIKFIRKTSGDIGQMPYNTELDRNADLERLDALMLGGSVFNMPYVEPTTTCEACKNGGICGCTLAELKVTCER